MDNQGPADKSSSLSGGLGLGDNGSSSLEGEDALVETLSAGDVAALKKKLTDTLKLLNAYTDREVDKPSRCSSLDAKRTAEVLGGDSSDDGCSVSSSERRRSKKKKGGKKDKKTKNKRKDKVCLFCSVGT